MVAIDFPNSPALNDTFIASGRAWIWNGTVWNSQSNVGGYYVSETAPEIVTDGDVWFCSASSGDLAARTFVRYDGYWVESTPGTLGPIGPTGATGADGATGPQGPPGPTANIDEFVAIQIIGAY